MTGWAGLWVGLFIGVGIAAAGFFIADGIHGIASRMQKGSRFGSSKEDG